MIFQGESAKENRGMYKPFLVSDSGLMAQVRQDSATACVTYFHESGMSNNMTWMWLNIL